jgi:uncharacterized membrane protein
MYLVHATLIKTVLVWAVHVFLPYLETVLQLNRDGERVNGYVVHYICSQFIRALMNAFIFVAWMALMIYVSKIWTDHVDRAAVAISRHLEEMFSDKSGIKEEKLSSLERGV